MTVRILFAALEKRWAEFEVPLRAALSEAGMAYELAPDLGPPETIDYIVYAPNSDVQDFSPFTRTKAVLGLWAGVEDVVYNTTLTQPFARMVDDGLTRGMVEWVTGHVLRHHLGMDPQIKKAGNWEALHYVPPLAQDRHVTILGLGALGRACAETLSRLGFSITGWSRSPKDIPGVACLHGNEGLQEALSVGDIVVLLVPNTPETQNLLNAETLGHLPTGSVIVNPGRGPLIDDDALIAALETGQVGHATLDVFRIEPLPEQHPYWTHPGVTITPHIASETRASSAARVIAQNVQRGETGQPFLYLLDRELGY